MTTLIIYSENGNSVVKISNFLKEKIDNSFQMSVENNRLEDFIKSSKINGDICFLIVTSNSGDGEVSPAIENFIINQNWKLFSNSYFLVCELGIYNGYEDSSNGAAYTITNFLINNNLKELKEYISIDTMPINDYSILNKWLKNSTLILKT